MTNELTVAQLQKAIPSRKNTITKELVDEVNRVSREPEFQGESILTTILTYSGMMEKHRASVSDYIHAIRFCAYLVVEDDNLVNAYKRAFANREFVYSRAGCKTDSPEYAALTSAASRYRKSKLVVDILTVSQAPLSVMYQGHRFKAFEVLADRMKNSAYDKDKIAAADALLKHTAPTETMKLELDIGVKESSATQNLLEQLAMIAGTQKKMINAGAISLTQAGAMKITSDVMEGEYVER
jgi:hypothetical protein